MLHLVSRRLRHALALLACCGLLGLAFAPAQAADSFTPTTDFTDNGDGTVTHKPTGLTWMRCALGQTWTGATCSGTASSHIWDAAKALTSTFANHSDWRLPNPWELATIVDYDIYGPAINGTLFPNTPSSHFWSGTPYASNSGSAWYVSFYYGYAYGNDRYSAYSVRLVRSGQSLGTLTTPSADFTDNGNGTVTHKKTQLTWKRCAEGQSWTGSNCTGSASTYTYDQAVALTGSFVGQADWRTPNIQELQSIIEYGAVSPAINATIFPNTPSLSFWSGSPYVYGSGYAWSVGFDYGNAYDGSRSDDHPVRLVRGGQPSAPLPVAIVPTALTVSAPPTLQSAGRTPLAASASYSNSTSKTVNPAWSSSNPAVATVSVAGVLTAGSVTVDTPVTLTASYTENGTTVTASKTLTITAAPAALASIAIAGGSAVSSGGLVRLAATATYSDGSSRGIAVSAWSVSPTSLGSINSRGELTASSVTADTMLTVTASYTEGSITQTASLPIALKATPATLESLGVVLERGSLAAGESISIVAESGYADGSGKRVPVNWSLAPAGAASIANGKLTAGTVSTDTPVTITATYSEGGKTIVAKYSVIVLATAEAPKLTAEVIATQNAQNLAKLQLWFNSEAGATVRNMRGGSYKIYVAAIVPAGPLVSAPTLFVLNRSKEWQALSWPLAEYLSGVKSGEWQLIELLDGVDLSLIAGAQILVGYGETEQDMLDNQRYRVAYQVP